MLFSLVLTFVFLRRKFPVALDLEAVAKSIAASFAMVAIIELDQVLWYSKFLLPIYVVSGLAAYLLALRFLKANRPEDVDLLWKTIGRRSETLCKRGFGVGTRYALDSQRRGLGWFSSN